MTWFNGLKVRTRLLAVFLLMSAITALVGFVRIAAGDLTVKMESGLEKDTGVFAAMKAMVEKLTSVIGEVRTGADALSSAASEVSATSQTLSQGTGEQAESLQQLMSFFTVRDDHRTALARPASAHAPQLPLPPAPRASLPHPTTTSKPTGPNGAARSGGGFERF